MIAHKLKINDDKTESMIISSKHMQKGLEKLSFHIASTAITSSTTVRNPGTMLNSVINMEEQVTSIYM